MPTSGPKKKAHIGITTLSQEEKDSKSLFVGGLSCKTPRHRICQIFEQFGKIDKIKMIKNKKGGSKGYCFILFFEVQSVRRALDNGDIWCDGRILNCRPILRGKKLDKFMQKVDNTRVQCKNIPLKPIEIEKLELRTLFEQFGRVENFYFALDKTNPIQPKRQELVVYVTYSSAKEASKALNAHLVYKGKLLKVSKFKRIDEQIIGQRQKESKNSVAQGNPMEIPEKTSETGLYDRGRGDSNFPSRVCFKNLPNWANNAYIGQYEVNERQRLLQYKQFMFLELKNSSLQSICSRSEFFNHFPRNIQLNKPGISTGGGRNRVPVNQSSMYGSRDQFQGFGNQRNLRQNQSTGWARY